MHPKIITTTDVNIRALSGSPSLGCTRAKNLDAGRPPSLYNISLVYRGEGEGRAAYRANAKIIRLLVVMTLSVANNKHTSGSLYSYQPIIRHQGDDHT